MFDQLLRGSAVAVGAGFRNIVDERLTVAVIAGQISVMVSAHDLWRLYGLTCILDGQRAGTVEPDTGASLFPLVRIIGNGMAVQVQRGANVSTDIRNAVLSLGKRIDRDVVCQVIITAGTQLCQIIRGADHCSGGFVETDDTTVALGSQANLISSVTVLFNDSRLNAVPLFQFPVGISAIAPNLELDTVFGIATIQVNIGIFCAL